MRKMSMFLCILVAAGTLGAPAAWAQGAKVVIEANPTDFPKIKVTASIRDAA